jgi:NADPH2:quinone reductase
VKDFPTVLGTEAAGVSAALPTDEAVLAHPEYKKRGFAVGGKVAVVRPFPPRRLRPG